MAKNAPKKLAEGQEGTPRSLHKARKASKKLADTQEGTQEVGSSPRRQDKKSTYAFLGLNHPRTVAQRFLVKVMKGQEGTPTNLHKAKKVPKKGTEAQEGRPRGLHPRR